MTANEAGLLCDALREAAAHSEAVPGSVDRYGRRYAIDFAMTGATKSVVVRSAWIVRTNEILPRLVTCYIM